MNTKQTGQQGKGLVIGPELVHYTIRSRKRSQGLEKRPEDHSVIFKLALPLLCRAHALRHLLLGLEGQDPSLESAPGRSEELAAGPTHLCVCGSRPSSILFRSKSHIVLSKEKPCKKTAVPPPPLQSSGPAAACMVQRGASSEASGDGAGGTGLLTGAAAHRGDHRDRAQHLPQHRKMQIYLT